MVKKVIIFLILFAFPFSTSLACTQWASVGSSSAGHALIFAKNRDAGLNGTEKLSIIHQHGAIPYLALVYNHHRDDGGYPYISWGINQSGLLASVASATVKDIVRRDAGETAVLTAVLSQYDSVSEVLMHAKKLFSHHRVGYYMIADAHQLMLVEVGLNGQYKIKTFHNGYLYHTNHYIFPSLQYLNIKAHRSSSIRYQSIKTLLDSSTKPYQASQFKAWLNYQRHGDNDSLFRKNTLASIVAVIPQQGDPSVYIRFTNPNQDYHVYQLSLNQTFWQKTAV